jgi:electron-transferring-flavoprotein dehydrogenase
MLVDVLIVGGGPAGLSAAIRLAQLQSERGGAPLSIAVLEKAREAGAHTLSGAVLDCSALRLLLPGDALAGAPLGIEVTRDEVLVLTASSHLPLPIVPPPLRNHGHHVVSLSAVVRWMAEQAERLGVDVFTGFAGQALLVEDGRVVGVRTGDRGVARDGTRKASFEPGVDIRAAVTILCDGVRGNLTKQLLQQFPLGVGREPQQFAVGLKELWEVPRGRVPSGTVMHTLGYPLDMATFGGGFIYALPESRLSVGFVVGLDYRDPMFDPHIAFNQFKQHPFVAALLAGGQMLRYGAKALPEGGWNTIPRPYVSGALIAGDAGGFLNSLRLKGVHLAMRTGMLAAETAFDAVRAGDTSDRTLKSYEERIEASEVRTELYPVRNVHQAFGHGLVAGLGFAGVSLLTRGWWPRDLQGRAGHQQMARLRVRDGGVSAPIELGDAPVADRRYTFDKATNVHYSGAAHGEDQPVHLLVHTEVCTSICGPEYGYPCTRFCPAQVYEIVREAEGPRLQINASNCVHCKTCDIMDPYAVITWVPPEGGGGPQYNGM